MIKPDAYRFLKLTPFFLLIHFGSGSAKMCDNILLLEGILLKCVGLCEEKAKKSVELRTLRPLCIWACFATRVEWWHKTGPYVNRRHFKTWWIWLGYLWVLCSQKKTTYLKYVCLWAGLSQRVKCSTLYFHHDLKYSFALIDCAYVRENMLVSGSQVDVQYFLKNVIL